VKLTVEVTSHLELPSGRDPGLEVDAFGIPIKKGDGPRSTKLDLLNPLHPLSAIVLDGDPADAVAATANSQWALSQLHNALANRGIAVRQCNRIGEVRVVTQKRSRLGMLWIHSSSRRRRRSLVAGLNSRMPMLTHSSRTRFGV